MRLLNSNVELAKSIKEDMLAALNHYVLQEYLIKKGKASQYTLRHRDESWTKFYVLFAACCRKGSGHFDNYLEFRAEVLYLAEFLFTAELQEEIPDHLKETAAIFFKWLLKAGFSEQDVRYHLHISQFKHSLMERGLWNPLHWAKRA